MVPDPAQVCCKAIQARETYSVRISDRPASTSNARTRTPARNQAHHEAPIVPQPTTQIVRTLLYSG